MKRICKILLLSLIIISNSNATSLNDALASTYESNPSLNATREELKATDEQVMQALAKWLPSVGLDRTKQFIDSETFPTASTGTPTKGAGTIDSLTVKQNLFRGGGDVATMKVAQYSIKQIRANLTSTEQKTLASAVEVYMRVLQTQEAYKMSQQKEKDIKHYVTAVTKRFEAGQNTKTDVAQAETSYADAIAYKATTYSSYRYFSALFLKVTGLEATNLSVPKDNLILPKTLDETTNIALKQNPNLIAAKSKYEATDSAVGTHIASLLPTIDFQYSIQDYSNARNIIQTSTHAKVSKTTALSLNIPLFNGGANWSRTRESKRKAKQAKYDLNNTHNEVIALAVQAWQESKSAKTSYDARKEGVKSAKIAYEGVIAEERGGLRDVTDVITIRNKYYEAVNALLDARSTYFIKMYALKSQVGECTAQGLNLDVELYDPLKNYKQIRWQFISAYTGD